MANPNFKFFLVVPFFPFLLLHIHLGIAKASDLQMSYYSTSCPKAEEIIKEQVTLLYKEHGNTAVSWLRNLFHDCMVKLGGPDIAMKTGRKDSMTSYLAEVENFIPNHNDTMDVVLSQFQSIGIDAPGTVALLGAHSVGRVHCINIVNRLYPDVDPTLDPAYAEYLKLRCPATNPDPRAMEPNYARNDLETPMVLDNMYYKGLLEHKGLLVIDQELATHPATSQFVQNMAVDNGYFHDQFSRALLIMSENNPLTGDQGEIRKDCRFVNSN
ncbi:unnamed protein product [Cuscuta epithymum]|uniref:peroxidase n=1 Tax=Cuscuta epithymum TaxID=186058 RepID=A0AAV0F8N5_9ASTE|nr:unnamed protein product [Cuscuta epithymum]